MAYKTIFTALTQFDETATSLDLAIDYTQSFDANLEVLCLGLDRTQSTYYELGSNSVIMHAAIEEAHQNAKDIYQGIKAKLTGMNLQWDIINSVVTTTSVGRAIATQARFADLAIVGLPFSDNKKPGENLILEGLLFEADCPTVVVPQNSNTQQPDNIVIGWNESPEATRAVKAALPFLKAASKVHIAIVDPPETGPERSDPGGALTVFLARHGVRCDIQVISRNGSRISQRLAQHVKETGSDMLVMGAYGHSRFREAILGGATRDMLEHSEVPVMLAH
ncbi:MAG: universal stress protein [Roseobacter sp.]